MFKITPGTCVCDQVPRDDSINLSNIIMIDYKCSYKSTQVRLITKYLGPCTQAPNTDVLAKTNGYIFMYSTKFCSTSKIIEYN